MNMMNFLQSGRAYFGLLSLLRSCYSSWSEANQNIENPILFTTSMGEAVRVDVEITPRRSSKRLSNGGGSRQL